MNRKFIAKELLKAAKDILAGIDFESDEYNKYRRFIYQARKDFSKFGTTIATSLTERDFLKDDTPVASINISATGGMTEKELDDFADEFNKAYKYIKGKEKEAQKMYKDLLKK